MNTLGERFPVALVTVDDQKKNLAKLTLLADQAEGFARDAKAQNTQDAYAADLKSFGDFCEAHKLDAFPASPQTVVLYLTDLAVTPSPKTGKPRALATIRRRAVAIAQAHKNAGLPNPVAEQFVRAALQGLARKKGSAQRKKTALTGDLLRDALRTLDACSLMGARDRAIVLLGFACASRRSEIAALNVEDLTFTSGGLVVKLTRSKVDQEGAGREIGVPLLAPSQKDVCAVRAVKAWLKASGVTEGALFRTFGINGRGKKQPLTERRISGRDVANLVQRVTGKADLPGDFAGHSLRAGFITQAARTKDVTEGDIQNVSGHRSVPILRGYVRHANVLENSPLARMFK